MIGQCWVFGSGVKILLNFATAYKIELVLCRISPILSEKIWEYDVKETVREEVIPAGSDHGAMTWVSRQTQTWSEWETLQTNWRKKLIRHTKGDLVWGQIRRSKWTVTKAWSSNEGLGRRSVNQGTRRLLSQKDTWWNVDIRRRHRRGIGCLSITVRYFKIMAQNLQEPFIVDLQWCGGVRLHIFCPISSKLFLLAENRFFSSFRTSSFVNALWTWIEVTGLNTNRSHSAKALLKY